MWTGRVCLKQPLVLLHDSCVQFVGKELSYRPLSVEREREREREGGGASLSCRLRGDAIGVFRRVARDINSFLQRGVTVLDVTGYTWDIGEAFRDLLMMVGLTLSHQLVTICTTSLTFNNSTFLPTQCIYVFCMDLRTNSDNFSVQVAQILST